MEPVASGRHLLHYIVGEKIGEGGMGVVYKGTDTRLKRPVALKFLTQALPSEASERKRFLREAQAASAINHPNVCVVHAIEEAESEEFLVMEFVEGLTLRKWISRRKAELGLPTLPVKDALSLAVQVADGLDAAHRKGIVHRDVKPENVMVTEDGRAKVMDFGLAKLMGESRLTRPGATLGTVAYMSPEQVQGGEVDQKSDIYSFGVLLYEMLAGTIPFQAEHAIGMMYAIVNMEPKPLLEARPGIDAGLERIVMKCIAKGKSARYASMRDAIRDIAAYGEETRTIIAPAVTGFSAGRGATRGRTGAAPLFVKKNLLWAALVAVVGATIFLITRTSSTSDARLTINSSPQGSEVFINGTKAGVTPLEAYRVAAGRTQIHLTQRTFVPVDTTVETAADQSMIVYVPLRLLEERKDTSRQLAAAEKSVPRSSEPEPSPEVPAPRGPVRAGSIDDLASTLVNQLSGNIGTPRGTVAVRPFTFRNTQIGSEFSRYFRSILEARASRLAKWSIVSSEDGSGKVLASMGAPLEYEVTGTYWPLPGVVRVFALLRNPRTFVVAAQAEAMVSNVELRKLGIALLPGNIKQILDDGRRVGTPVPATGDLKLELFTNKGVENLVFSDGDTLEISVRVNKPCTVRAFYHAADGRRYLLTGEADLKIEPSRVNSIVQIRMVECAPPFGAEILQAFATTGAFESIRTKYVENGFYELQEKVEDAMIATRGIKKLAGASGLVEKRVVVTTVAK